MNSVTYNKYLKYKDDINKSYNKKFKKVRIGAYIFSIFGNIISVFFAYFFFATLFSTAMFNISGVGVTIGIISFLSLFEYIKRYVFDIFSSNYLKDNKNIFAKNKISFLLMTLLIVSSSFFFSLNGAQDMVNKDKLITSNNEKSIQIKIDSLNNYYNVEIIKPVKSENSKLLEQKDKITEQQSKLISNRTNISRLDGQIKSLNDQISNNKVLITKYEKHRDSVINETKIKEYSILNSKKSDNRISIIYFLILSTLIETIILMGVYYNRYYEYKSMKEYEETIINTVEFKKWRMCHDVLNLIFSYGDIKINESLPSTNSLLEIVNINELKLKQKDLIDSFKIFSYLKIYESKGNKRLLKLNKSDAISLIDNYFDIKN